MSPGSAVFGKESVLLFHFHLALGAPCPVPGVGLSPPAHPTLPGALAAPGAPPGRAVSEMLTQLSSCPSRAALIKGCPTVLAVEPLAPLGDREQPGICLQNDITKEGGKKKTLREGGLGWKALNRAGMAFFVVINM